MTAVNYITPHGFKRLQDEYHYLKGTLRPEMTKLVSWAASLGDRSENADYQYGKKKLREIDRRLRFLSGRIEQAQVVDPLNITSDKVQFSATVVTSNENGDEVSYKIVGVDETSIEAKRISFLSPMGKSLLGKEEGDIVTVKAPKGDIELEVVRISYEEIIIEEYVYEGARQHQSR